MEQLRPHQLDAISRMHNGCVLRGGTGSGKTITSLVYIFQNVLNGQSLLDPKNKEYAKPKNQKKVYIITTPKKRDSLDWEREATWVPIDIFKIDSWNNIKKYEDVKDAVFIFDETRILGYGSWTKSFLKIAKNNFWILLSATPADTWVEYMALFIANGFYKNKTEFEREHIVWNPYGKYKKIQRYLNITKLTRLRDSILVNMYLTRNTIQHHINLDCGYDEEFYDVLYKSRWNFYEEEPIRDVSQLCFLLRKLVNSDPSRLSRVKEVYEAHNKVIIFYNHDHELHILRKWAEENNVKYSEWNGHKHEELPKGDNWIYLCQYTAAKEAWNCIETDCMLFYSQTYSYKTLEQSCGRIDRMNTPYSDLYYYHLRSNSSIDNAIKSALGYKKNFNEASWLK